MRLEERAVSEVIGEMMLIAIVLILVAIFATSLFSFIPEERAPVVTIKMNCTPYDEVYNLTTVCLWHKGGDWVEVSDLSVIVIKNETMTRYRYNDADYPFTLYGATGEEVPTKQSFDLGDYICLSLDGDAAEDEIRLVTPRAVLFDGVIG